MEKKKTNSADLNKKRTLFLAIGLLISTGLTFAAFQWRQFGNGDLMDFGSAIDNFEDLIDIPPTKQPPLKAPPKQQPEILPIPDDLEIEDIDINVDVEISETTEIANLIIDEEQGEETTDDPFMIVEDQAVFPGGGKAWGKYLQKNLDYPRTASRMGIEGSVHLSFVVDKEGIISDVEIIRGIGGGCDEEAKRALENSPKWEPGRQRGVAVKSRMGIRILFRLKKHLVFFKKITKYIVFN